MGLGGLAVALLVGVISFAVTTTPANQSGEPVSRSLTVPDRILGLSLVTSGASRISERTASLIGPADEPGDEVPNDAPSGQIAGAQIRDAQIPGGQPLAITDGRAEGSSAGDERRGEGPAVVRAGNRAFETSPVIVSAPIPPSSLPRVLAAERTPLAPEATVPLEVPPAEVAGPVDPVLSSGDRVTATVSFYYCERGEHGNAGDGGNFCGAMRDGTVVHSGAAACAYAYLGQEFRIVGDPTERTYRCADTGSAVHGQHRDIWFMTSDEGWAWQSQVGQVAEIEILR